MMILSSLFAQATFATYSTSLFRPPELKFQSDPTVT